MGHAQIDGLEGIDRRRMQATPVMFWISINGDGANLIMDAPLRRYLFQRAPARVVLNSEQDGYAELVAAIKAEYPSIKVLRYSNAQLVPEGSRVAATMFDHFLKNAATEALILKHKSKPKIAGTAPNRTIWTDITIRATRDFITSHIAEQIALCGADGVAVDSFRTQLDPYTPYIDGAAKNAAWPAAGVNLLKAIRAALPRGKEIWFNGLWSFKGAGQLARQAALLPYATGAAVEFFGYDGRGKVTTNTFDVFVNQINAVLAANPTKPILVNGTTEGRVFIDYLADLRNARYCFGCYLLGKTPGSYFRYGQNFQVKRLPRERAGALALYIYHNLPLGSPVGPAVNNGTSGYSRILEGGVVFVAPAEGGTQKFQVPFPCWSVTRKMYAADSVVKLREGDALVLVKDQPDLPPTLSASIADSSSEWLLENVAGEYRYRTLKLRVRSSDVESALLLRFETDDNPRPFGILEILPIGGTFDAGNLDYAYGQAPFLGAAHVQSGAKYTIDNSWRGMKVDLQAECHPYPFYRAISARAIGAVEIGSIQLSDPEAIV